MTAKFEDLAAAVANADSPFDLASDFPLLKAGVADLAKRLHGVEAFIRTLSANAHPAPVTEQKG